MKRPPLRNQLPRSFYAQPTRRVARELLGKVILRRIGQSWVGGVIVETEAYLSRNDPASHASRGKTCGNASMFANAGTLYVYPIHAKHCMNAVTERSGVGCAVLIRAIEPIWGIEIMRANRGRDELRRLTRGPGMLCQALGIDRSVDGTDLPRSREFLIADVQLPKPTIARTPRIGIRRATESLLRFVVVDNRYTSGPRPG